MPTIVIIGGGLAGAKTAEALREKDFNGDIVLFGAEDRIPYERPPLSKDFLLDKKSFDDFTVHHGDWYRDNRIDFRPGTAITSVNTTAKTVALPDGSPFGYDSLVLATGSRSRHLDIPGSDAAHVHYLRNLDEAEALRDDISEGTRVVAIGAGWIGLEVASSAKQRGAHVTVVEQADVPLAAAMGEEVGNVFAKLHRDNGIDLRTGVGVEEIVTADGAARGVRLAGGETIDADVVLVAAGAVPNLEPAESAGLDIDGGGVLVSAGLQSSDPNVYVVGDIANAQHPLLHRRIRTEHWANALNQPAVAAANILGGSEEFSNLPYFFTDQFDLGMEYVGLSTGYDKVVFRGDVDAREFVVCWLDNADYVLAGMQVNIWDQLDDIKALVTSPKCVDPAKLADPNVPLGDLI